MDTKEHRIGPPIVVGKMGEVLIFVTLRVYLLFSLASVDGVDPFPKKFSKAFPPHCRRRSPPLSSSSPSPSSLLS